MADVEESMIDLDPEGAIGDEDINYAAHEKLLDSIYALDGKKRIKNQVRGAGISSNNLDLLVHTKKESTKIEPSELNLKDRKSNLVAKPLTSLETEKAKRAIARDVMAKDTKKWEPLVHEIRVAPQIKYSERPKGLEMYKAMQPQKFSPRTPLEVELYEALGKSEDVITPDEPLTKAERNALKAMSVNEAMERRKELMLHHELLSRMQIKAKRIKKIKSKRFRRGQRKDKDTEEKRRLEQLKQTDPGAFLEKMEEVEKARMEERLTLKHKSGGKFARYHKAYSKYDDTTREAVQEMIRKGKELTQKKRQTESSDEEEEEEVVMADILASKAVKGVGDANKDDESAAVSDLNSGHLEMLKAINKKAGGWLDSTTKYVYRNDQTESSSTTVKDVECSSKKDDDDDDEDENELSENSLQPESDTKSNTSKKRKREDSHIDDVEKPSETEHVAGLSEGSQKKSPKKKRVIQGDEEEKSHDVISETPAKKQKVMPLDTNSSESKTKISSPKKSTKAGKIQKDTDDVKNSAMKKGKGKREKVVEFTLKPTNLEKMDKETDAIEREEADDEEQLAVTMEELFEDEDVVEQFARDKAEEEEKRKPKKEDTKLPGWGSWSGPDYKEIAEKRQQRRKKFQPKLKPKKDLQPNLWLNPNRDESIRQFQPKRVPFPYVDAQQYQSANRQPVSRGFVRETVHKILIKPEVVTKMGHIIKPLDKDDFFKKTDSLDMEYGLGKEIKYAGPVNFKQRDERLTTKS